MSRTFIIAFAYVGIIVGAAFASGRESLQFYTSFGLKGTFGAILATPLYAYFGMMLVKIGYQLKSKNHYDTIKTMMGNKLGRLIDYIIIFTMVVTGIGMIAGGGALLEQQFGLPLIFGNLLMTVIVTITLMLQLEKIVIAIGFLTPVLLLTLIIVCVYSIMNNQQSFESLEPLVLQTKTTMPDSLPNWFVSSINHASFNVTVGIGMALVMGGNEKNLKSAIWGGILGGVLIGAIILVSHFALFSQINLITSFDANGNIKVAALPVLAIVDSFSPFLSLVMTFIIFGMIYNTCVSMFYVFIARYNKMPSKKANRFIIITMIIGYAVSFVGFTDIVGVFYPIIGYAGLVLIAMLLYAPFKLKKLKQSEAPHNAEENVIEEDIVPVK